MSYGISFPSVEIKMEKFDLVCLPYSERWGTLPARKMEVSKLASELLGISLLEANSLFDGKTDERFTRLLQDKLVIVISKNNSSYDEANSIGKMFTELGIRTEVIGKTLDDYRNETIENILK